MTLKFELLIFSYACEPKPVVVTTAPFYVTFGLTIYIFYWDPLWILFMLFCCCYCFKWTIFLF